MNVTDLGGHSGCRIMLYEKENNVVFVRKISSSREYNERLKKQVEKQCAYKNPKIYTPKVLNKGFNDKGLFYFDMEYIQGITMSEYIRTIPIGGVRSICEMIVNNIICIPCDSSNADEFVFKNKIYSLEQTLRFHNNDTINQAISMLKKHPWNKFVKTQCHGDLTLENIIVKDNQLYLIDFLDSFYDSWILDISTIMQDVQVMWSYRHDKNEDINTKIRLLVFRDILMDTVKNISPEEYIEVYYALLLKLIRIYPYTNDKETYHFLNKKTKALMELIQGE